MPLVLLVFISPNLAVIQAIQAWPWLKISDSMVARVNIIPATTFHTIPLGIAQWFSTATGNNDSQLQELVLTLDIPVSSEPVSPLHTYN